MTVSSRCSSAERLEFAVKPRDASLVAGTDVTITCSAQRASSLSWRRVGVSTLPDHVTSVDGRLRLRGVRRSDAGLYVCTATSRDHSQSVDATIRIDVTGDIRHHDVALSISTRFTRRQAPLKCLSLLPHTHTHTHTHTPVYWPFVRGDYPGKPVPER